MDVNEFSRRMYENVPEGGTLYTVDKIGLRIDARHLNKGGLAQWKANNPITVLTFGETAQINVHAEFEMWEEHLGKRCLDAVLLLMWNNVFTMDFCFMFLGTMSYMPRAPILDGSCQTVLLSFFFRVAEWETAIDFLDFPPFSAIDTDGANKKSLRQFIDSYYSRDERRKKRLRERDGKQVLLSKGHQRSLFIYYDRGKKTGGDRQVKRVELRQQGKYGKDLSNDLLDGTKDDAFDKAAPIIRRAIKKAIHKDALKLSDYWKDNTPREYAMIFGD